MTSSAAESILESAEPSSEDEAHTESDETKPIVTFSGAQLADGTYQGSANGYHGMIYLSVTVIDGKVTDITIDQDNETPKYFSRAITIIDRIISSQSLDVDAISGATFSSRGICEAVYDALQQAVVSGELSNVQINM